MKLTEQKTNPISSFFLEAAKYRGESQHFTYETYVLVFEKNMRILSSNIEEMRDARSVQKFLSGIECP